MASAVRIKRRWNGNAGAPASLKSGELAYNGVDNILYIGFGDDGAGNATSVKAVAAAAVIDAVASKIDSSQKGAANGVASLDGTGKVPAAQLPAFVDDVLEYANQAAFPATGDSGVLYVAVNVNKVFRWSGSAYIEIVGSPGSTDAVPEGATNKYFTDARAVGAVVVQTITSGDTAHSPSSGAVFTQLGLKANLAGPAFTGTPTAPTAATATNTTQLATTAFVQANITNLALGTMSKQNANSVAITGGTIDGVTIDGGTF